MIMIVIEKSSIINGNWNAHAQRCNVVIHSVDQRTATIKFRSAFGFDQCSHVLSCLYHLRHENPIFDHCPVRNPELLWSLNIAKVDERTATIKFQPSFVFNQFSHVLVESIIETSEVTEMRVSCYYQKSEFRKVEFLRIELKVDFGLEGGPISNLLGTSGFHSE